MMFRVQSRLPQLFIQRPCVTSTSKSQSLAATVAPLVLSVPSLLAMSSTVSCRQRPRRSRTSTTTISLSNHRSATMEGSYQNYSTVSI
ncbi:hypothetical protein LINPERPRIM_LOCUS39398 [Linum perenne]